MVVLKRVMAKIDCRTEEEMVLSESILRLNYTCSIQQSSPALVREFYLLGVDKVSILREFSTDAMPEVVFVGQLKLGTVSLEISIKSKNKAPCGE